MEFVVNLAFQSWRSLEEVLSLESAAAESRDLTPALHLSQSAVTVWLISLVVTKELSWEKPLAVRPHGRLFMTHQIQFSCQAAVWFASVLTKFALKLHWTYVAWMPLFESQASMEQDPSGDALFPLCGTEAFTFVTCLKKIKSIQ